MERLVEGLGLAINQEKTRVVRLPEDSFDFLGYSFGQHINRHGEPYLGTRPAKKAIRRLMQSIHDETAINTTWDSVTYHVQRLNALLRAWTGHFSQGPVLQTYRTVERYSGCGAGWSRSTSTGEVRRNIAVIRTRTCMRRWVSSGCQSAWPTCRYR